jgi:hypothetical protein
VGNKKPGINGASTPPPGFCKNDVIMTQKPNVYHRANALLIHESPLQVLPSLAVSIGLNEAIVLQQVHYWLGMSKNVHDGRLWVYNTYEQWAEQFPFWSPEFIRKIVKSLRDKKLIEARQLSPNAWDKTNSYTINYEVLEEVCAPIPDAVKLTASKRKNPPHGDGKKSRIQPDESSASNRENPPHLYTETTAETTTETTAETFPPVAVAPVAGPVFPPIDDTVVEQAKPAPVGTVAVVEAAEVVEHTPTAKPKRKRTVVDTGADETALQAACRTTWAAYSGAYAIRYGVAPLRNAKVNAAIKGFVQRIGHAESPAVAAYYVANVNDSFVVRNMHDTGLLLKQAEGYRTQWATGRSVTATAARQADQTAANLSVVEEAKLIARARRAAREAARLAGEDFL